MGTLRLPQRPLPGTNCYPLTDQNGREVGALVSHPTRRSIYDLFLGGEHVASGSRDRMKIVAAQQVKHG